MFSVTAVPRRAGPTSRPWQKCAVAKVFQKTDEFEDWGTKVPLVPLVPPVPGVSWCPFVRHAPILWPWYLESVVCSKGHRLKEQPGAASNKNCHHCNTSNYNICSDTLASGLEWPKGCNPGLTSGEALLLRLRWTLAAAQLWPADAFRLLDARLKTQVRFRSFFLRGS